MYKIMRCSILTMFVGISFSVSPAEVSQELEVAKPQAQASQPLREPSWRSNKPSLLFSAFCGLLHGLSYNALQDTSSFLSTAKPSDNMRRMLSVIAAASICMKDPQRGYRELSFAESWLRALSMHAVSYGTSFMAGQVLRFDLWNLFWNSVDASISPLESMALMTALGIIGQCCYYLLRARHDQAASRN